MKYIKSNNYDKTFVNDNLMGPNCMKILEELLLSFDLQKGMRVLDLGCGKALTSVFLAKEFGVKAFATDLWISATKNYETIKSMNLEDQVIPIHADAKDLPFADEYFDAIVSIDSYYYFGADADYMDKLAPLVKKGGTIALAFPGVKNELKGKLPQEMMLSWAKAEDDILKTFHSIPWWRDLLEKSNKITVESIQEMQCFEETWQDWLTSENEYADLSRNDRLSMNAGAGKYMNIISIVAKRK